MENNIHIPYQRLRERRIRPPIQSFFDYLKTEQQNTEDPFVSWLYTTFLNYSPIVNLHADVHRMSSRLKTLETPENVIEFQCKNLVIRRVIDLFSYFYCLYTAHEHCLPRQEREEVPCSTVTSKSESEALSVIIAEKDDEHLRILRPKSFFIIKDGDILIIQAIIDYTIDPNDIIDSSFDSDKSLQLATKKYREKLQLLKRLMNSPIYYPDFYGDSFNNIREIQLSDNPSIIYIVSPNANVNDEKLKQSNEFSEYYAQLPVGMNNLREFIQTLLDTLLYS